VAAATARLAGSTKFGRPQKRKRFWGARTSPTRGALCERRAPDEDSHFKHSS